MCPLSVRRWAAGNNGLSPAEFCGSSSMLGNENFSFHFTGSNNGINPEFSWIMVYYMLLNSIIREAAAMILKLPNVSHKSPHLHSLCIFFYVYLCFL